MKKINKPRKRIPDIPPYRNKQELGTVDGLNYDEFDPSDVVEWALKDTKAKPERIVSWFVDGVYGQQAKSKFRELYPDIYQQYIDSPRYKVKQLLAADGLFINDNYNKEPVTGIGVPGVLDPYIANNGVLYYGRDNVDGLLKIRDLYYESAGIPFTPVLNPISDVVVKPEEQINLLNLLNDPDNKIYDMGKSPNKASMVRRNKLINNLPKYDVGTTPISSGYQRATNSIPVGYVSLNGQNLSSIVAGLKGANTALYLNSGALLATLAIGAIDIAKQVSKGAISKSVGSMLSVAGAIPSAIGLYDSINKKGEFNGLGGNELDTVASKNTEYRNGVAYLTIGGVDSDSIMRAASARDTGENVGLTMNSLGVGAGIGGAVAGPVGALVGAGIGGLLSLFGWNNDEKKEQRRRLENFRIASNAANMLNEAVAASLGLLNEFYSTHADLGLSPHKGKKNALVGGGEVITKHDAYGNVVDAMMEPITPYTPEREDIIPVHLNDNDGVLGNKINPLTGNRFAVDARYNINNPQALTQLVALQDMVTKKNRMKKYDAGKFMNILSVLPGVMEMGVGAKLSHSYAKDPVVAFNPYTINNNAAAAANELASLHYNPYPMLNSLRETDRQAIYNMNTASLSPAQRMAMLSTYYNNKMRNKADILASGLQLENQYRASHANLLAQLGEQDATRRQQGNAAYADNFAKAQAAKRKGIETGWLTGLKGINTAIGNLLNNYWTNRNIGLYEQVYKPTPVDFEQINKQMASGFRMPTLQKNVPQPFTSEPKKPTYKANRQEFDDLYNWFLSRNPNMFNIS